MPAGALGSLVVALEANTASFEAAMGRMDYLAGKMADGVKAKISGLDAAFIGLANKGVDIAFNKIGDAIESLGPAAIAATAHLERMRQTLGGTVEGLSAISAVAKLSNTSVETLETGMARLTKGMVASDDTTKGAGLAFATLGVKARDAAGQLRPTEDVLKDVATALDGFQDGAGKAATAQLLFGRSGAQLLPMLHDMAIAGDLVGKVTAEQAKQAEDYEKNLKRLQASKEALVRTISLEVVPVFDALIEAYIEAQKQTGGLRDQVNGLAQDGSIRGWAEDAAMAIATAIDFFTNAWTVVKVFTDGLGAQAARIGANFKYIGGAAMFAAGQWKDGLRVMQDALRELASIAEEQARRIQGAFEKPADAAQQAVQRAFDQMRSRNVADAIYGATSNQYGASLYDTGKPKLNLDTSGLDVAKKQLDELGSVLDRIYEKASGLNREFAKSFEVLSNALMSGRLRAEEFGKAMWLFISQQPFVEHAFKRQAEALAYLAKYWQQFKEAQQESLSGQDQIINGLQDSAEAMKVEIATMGMSTAERERYNIVARTEIELKKALANDKITDDEAAIIRKNIEAERDKLLALVDVRTELQNQKAVWDDIGNRAGAFFSDLVEHGASAFRHLGDSLKKFAAEIVALFAKRFVLQMAASLTGMSGLGAMAANVGANTLGGSVMNSILGTAGGTGIGGYLFGSAEGATSTGLLTTGTEGLIGSGGFAATMGTAAEGLATSLGIAEAGAAAFGEAIVAAIPVVGWIAAAAMLAYSIFGNQGPHADKQQGSFAGAFDPSGHLTSTLNPDLSGITGNNQNPAAAQAIGQDIALGYAQAMRSLGLTPQALTIAAGFSTDPQGTAPSFMHTMVQGAGGQNLLSLRNDNIDRSPDALSTEIRRETEAAIVAGIEASMGDLPQALQDILKDVDPTTASLQQLDNVLKQLFETNAVIEGLKQINLRGLDISALQDWQHSGESISQTFQRVASAWQYFQQNFMTQSEQLALATQHVSQTFADLGVAVPASREDFLQLVQGLDLSTEAGRHMFEVLTAIAPQFLAVSNAADQARQQMESLSQGFAQAAITMHGGMGGALGQEWARGQLTVAAQHWLGLAGNDAGTMTVDRVISMIPQVDPAAALGFAQGIGTTEEDHQAGVQALKALFDAYNEWQNSLHQGTASTSTFTSNIDAAGQAAADYARQMTQAQDGIAQWLQSTLLDSNLSPYMPADRLDFALNAYTENTLKARMGNVGALADWTKYAGDYLKELRAYYGSDPAYLQGFSAVMGEGKSLAGLDDARSVTAGDMKAGFQSVVAAIARLEEVTGNTADRIAAVTRTAVERSSSSLAQAVNDGALSF